MLFATLAVVPVDFGSGAAGLRAHHWPSSCGGEGQKPCKIWQHVPSCKPGLVEVALTRCKKDEGIIKNVRDDAVALVNPNADPSCGGLGQQACVTSCDDNLMLSVDGGDRIHNRATIARMARSAAGEVGPVLEMIGRTILDCGVETIVRGLDGRNSAQAEDAAQRMIERNCIRVALEEAQNADYNTVTIGYGGGGSLLIGGEAEGGIAYDVGFNRMPSSYGVIGVNMGLQAGASPTSLIVSVYKGINQPGQDTFGGDGHGFA